MVASANPSTGGHSNGRNGGGEENVNGARGAAENSGARPNQSSLRHNVGLAIHWTPEEQSLLEDMLKTYASESSVVRYGIISQELIDKTSRDVALRCRWMSKRKGDNTSRRNKYKKERVTNPLLKFSQVANRFNGPASIGSEDQISFKDIGGVAGQILEQNAQALDQISANFSACKIHENIDLLCQARSNILSILKDSIAMPEKIKRMPPLPVKLNDDLAHAILPHSSLPK